MQVLEKVSRALSRNYGIRVVFRGNQACTDGKQIILPSLPEDLDESMEAKIRGYCDHEIGHLKYSCFDILKTIHDKELHNLTNLIEDIRIEKRLSDDYAGAKVNMEYTMTELAGEMDCPEHILNKLWVEGRRQVCGYEFKSIDDQTGDLKKAFGDDIFDRLKNATSSYDSLEIAKDILKKYEDQKKSQETPDPMAEEGEEQGDNEGEGDGGQGRSEEIKPKDETEGDTDGDLDEGDPDEDDPDEDSESDDSKSGGSEGDDSDSEGDGKSGDGGGGADSDGGGDDGGDKDGAESDPDEGGGGEEKSKSTPSGNPNDSDNGAPIDDELDDWSDDMDSLKEEIEQVHKGALEDGKYMVWDKSHDVIVPVPEGRNTNVFKKLKESLGGLNTMKGKMANMFLTRVASKWINDREEGKINGKALARVKTGYRNVYREKFRSRETDTAITFLVDFSGSMHGFRIENAMRAVVLFLETLKATKIKSEVLGYTCGNVPDSDKWYEEKNKSFYGRVESLRTLVIKEFNEPYGQKVQKRISNYRNVGMHNNNDPDSVKIAYDRIRRRPEKRKVLFVLTDGAVVSAGNDGIGRTYLKTLCKQIAKEGVVELIGIGMMAEEVREYYPKSIYLPKPDTLAKDLFDQLRKIFKVYGK